MGIDALCIKALKDEFNKCINNARVEKVNQTDTGSFILNLRGSGETYKLLLSADGKCGRIHLTEKAFNSAEKPSAFCMLLRKKLTGLRVWTIEQPELDRILKIKFTGFDSFGDPVGVYLYTEVLGSYCNIILTDESGIILDAFKKVYFNGSNRPVQPGLLYTLPGANRKHSFYASTAEEFDAALTEIRGEDDFAAGIKKRFYGLSPELIDSIQASAHDYTSLCDAAKQVRSYMLTDDCFSPCMIIQGDKRSYSLVPAAKSDGISEIIYYDSVSGLLDAFYSNIEISAYRAKLSGALKKEAVNNLSRLERKLAKQRMDLQRCDSKDELRIKAELIKANIYRIKKGDSLLKCENYYVDGAPEVFIELDPQLTPQQNAGTLFKQYNKLKNAEIHLTSLIADGEAELDYLNSVVFEINNIENEFDYLTILAELESAGYSRKRNSEKRKTGKNSKTLPYKLYQYKGTDILVGRNNMCNEELTFRIAAKSDMWLHVRSYHGSHVVVRSDRKELSQEIIEYAAGLAKEHSEARQSGKIIVDYTPIKFVRKRPKSFPGSVFYTDYKSIVVG